MPPKDQTTPATDEPTDDVDVVGQVDTDPEPADEPVDVNEGFVSFEVDGVTGYGAVIGQVDGDEHRENAVLIVPLPEPITVPVSALTIKD